MPKKKAPVLEKAVYPVYVRYRSERRETSIADPTDPWSRANTQSDHTVLGLHLERRSDTRERFEELCLPFVPTPGKFYSLLYLVYSTGDSFGHDEDSQIEFVGVYEDPQIALANQKTLEGVSDSPTAATYRGNIKLKTMDGKDTYSYHCSFVGYFECLSYVRVDTFMLGN